MDLTRYSALKAKGLITLWKVNDAHSATLLRYSPEDGQLTGPVTQAIDKKLLEQAIHQRKQELASLTELLTDLP